MEFSEWYSEILEKAKIYDVRYPVKGCGCYLPYGFKIREKVLEVIRKKLNEKGHEECLFPMLVPETFLMKEAEHIKGFEDEVFWVTHGGKEELGEKLALRPTSETVIYPIMREHIKSHGDLPIKIYQIVNCFRYETKHTRPLIRVREIMTFKEAHTFHASKEECLDQVKEAVEIYKEIFDELEIPYLICRRPEWDKFPGGEFTIAFDTILPSGKALQIGTVHNLGQNFAKTFDIKFETKEGKQDYVYQSCYGISDRVIASVLAIHGDENGLVLPSNVAPIQIVIIPLIFKNTKDKVLTKSNEIRIELEKHGYRVKLDSREDIRPGKKYYEYEYIGVPIRIEIGPKDLEEEKVVVFRRDTKEKVKVSLNDLIKELNKIIKEYDQNLKNRAKEKFESMIVVVNSIEEIKNIDGKVILIPFDKKIYNEELEEKTGLKVLGKTKYKDQKYIALAKTY